MAPYCPIKIYRLVLFCLFACLFSKKEPLKGFPLVLFLTICYISVLLKVVRTPAPSCLRKE